MLPPITAHDELLCQHMYPHLQAHAILLHSKQKDRGGNSYCEHLFFVANRQPTYAGRVIALFHDSIEDGLTTARGLLTYGLPDSIVARIVLISRRPEEDYDEYIVRVVQDVVTRGVKEWDLAHNLSLYRLREVSEKDLPRINRYLRAYHLIQEMKQ